MSRVSCAATPQTLVNWNNFLDEKSVQKSVLYLISNQVLLFGWVYAFNAPPLKNV